MIKVFTLLDYLFLPNFEIDYKDVFVDQKFNDYYETILLNINVSSEKLTNLYNFPNINIVDFAGENLFDYIYQNTSEASLFMMPHLIVNLPSLSKRINVAAEQLFLQKNYQAKNLERVLSCVKDSNYKEIVTKQFNESSIFSDSYFGTTLYSSDLMYGTKSFYSSLCDCFKELNNSNVLDIESHYKFDLILNLTLLKNEYHINSV